MKFHTEFEKIHPYQDGNGRIGRFLMFKQCVENGVDLISVDEKYSAEHKQGLFIAQTTGDFEPLRTVFKDCQQLPDEKLAFLTVTLECLKSCKTMKIPTYLHYKIAKKILINRFGKAG